jgi:hypothetical protein
LIAITDFGIAIARFGMAIAHFGASRSPQKLDGLAGHSAS